MASVRIDTGPVEASDYAAQVPRDQWRLLAGARASFVRTRLPYDCRELLRFVDEAEAMYAPLGYESVEDFIQRGLELDPQLVDWAIKGLKTIRPDEAVPFAEAVKLGKRGGDRRSDKAKTDQGDIITLKRGTSSAYRTARLERDFPAIAAALKSDEFPSVAAAWRAAGLEKPKDAVTVAIRAFLRLDAKQRRRFYDEVEKAAQS